MSATLDLALLLQVIAVSALRLRLGRTWLRRPAVLLILASVVYQGVSPLLMLIPSAGKWDIYRQGVTQGYADSAMLTLSAAMLAFTVAYLLTRPEQSPVTADPGDIRETPQMLDWRLLACTCLPLAVLTYSGRGWNSGEPGAGHGAPVTTDVAAEFFVILVLLTALAFLLRHGTRWFLPVIITQSVLLAAAGERTPVVMDAIALGVMLAYCGFRVPRGQLRAAGAVTLILVLALTGARAEHGRVIYHTGGLGERVSGLADGIGALWSGTLAGPGLLAQAAVRMDGTDFAAAIRQSEAFGQPRLSAAGVPDSLLLAVPSALWPSKITRGSGAHGNGLDPTITEMTDFGLQDINFLPGLPGMYAGFLSAPWDAALLAFLGLLAGWGERWLLRRATPARQVMLAGAVTAALLFEQGLPGILVGLRSAAVLAVAVKAIAVVRGRRRHHVPLPPASRAVPFPTLPPRIPTGS